MLCPGLGGRGSSRVPPYALPSASFLFPHPFHLKVLFQMLWSILEPSSGLQKASSPSKTKLWEAKPFILWSWHFPLDLAWNTGGLPGGDVLFLP